MIVSLPFPDDYAAARGRFLDLAGAHWARLDSYALAAHGPGDEALVTDIAWLGPSAASRVLVVQSGVHGVEAFAGSAVQCELLARGVAAAADTALVMVHVVNPYGMAWRRRVNDANVDLNRNCLGPGEVYAGAAPAYRRLNSLINPPSPPRRDFFVPRVLAQVVRHGFEPLKQALALGQYEYPMGLFYGGAALQPEVCNLKQWLVARLGDVEQIVVVDLHTGLGRFGACSVFPGLPLESGVARELAARLGPMRMAAVDNGGSGYAIKGGLVNLYRQACRGARLVYLTVEFGTWPMLKVLHALREENRAYFHGSGTRNHGAGKRLMRVLCPESERWRTCVVRSGVDLVASLFRYLAGADRGAAGA